MDTEFGREQKDRQRIVEANEGLPLTTSFIGKNMEKRGTFGMGALKNQLHIHPIYPYIVTIVGIDWVYHPPFIRYAPFEALMIILKSKVPTKNTSIAIALELFSQSENFNFGGHVQFELS